MSEERLDKALEALQNEEVSAADLSAAQDRVWRNLMAGQVDACTGFRAEMREYLQGGLTEARRTLMEDHLSRCASCRKVMAEERGEVKIVAMPAVRRPVFSGWRRWAVAAGVVAVLGYAGRDRLDTLLAPSGPRATIEVASGNLFKLPEGNVARGATLSEGDIVRTGPGARAVLRLADGSAVEVNERTELFVSAAWSGQTIHLQRGDVIVQAAKQRRGHLRVQTRDSVASVKGTIFAVSSGLTGSLVSVVEGSVEVTQPGTQKLLTRGEQSGSNAELSATPVRQSIAWSTNSEQYLALLGEFAKLEKRLAAIPSPALRTQPKLLPYLPSNLVFYGAIPNLAGTVKQAQSLADQQAGESPAFKDWWNSAHGTQLKEMLTRLQVVLPMVGDEVVFAMAANNDEHIPLLVTQVQSGQRGALKTVLDELKSVQYQLSDTLLIVSDTAAHLQWIAAQQGRGAASDFGVELNNHYQRGAGWLFAVNLAAMPQDKTQAQFRNILDGGTMKYAFFEQRATNGIEENEATIAFSGARAGVASWLAPRGAGAAAEYITSDALFAFSASTKDSSQLYTELVTRITASHPEFPEKLKEAEAKLGINVANDIAGALGSDFAVGVESMSPTPNWIAVAEVNKAGTLDGTISKLVDAFNGMLKPEDQAKRLTITQTTTNGQLWKTIKSGAVPNQIHWTYDRGYLVASNDLGVAARAIQTRNGGFPLIRSAVFEKQMPSSTTVSPSGFLWLNTKGALSSLAAKIPNAAVQKLAADRDPVLVIVNGETERIRLASRTRITSLVLDMMTTGSTVGGLKTLRH